MTFIEKLSKKTSDRLIDYLQITDQYKILEIHYSMERLFNNIFFICLLGFLLVMEEYFFTLNIVDDALIIYVVFSVIRSNFGGFHLDKDWMCLILSVLMIFIGAIVSEIIVISLKSIIILYIFVYFSIFYKKVIDNPNRPLSDKKKRKFFIRGLITISTIAAIHILFYVFDLATIVNPIYMALLFGFVNLYFVKKDSH